MKKFHVISNNAYRVSRKGIINQAVVDIGSISVVGVKKS